MVRTTPKTFKQSSHSRYSQRQLHYPPPLHVTNTIYFTPLAFNIPSIHAPVPWPITMFNTSRHEAVRQMQKSKWRKRQREEEIKRKCLKQETMLPINRYMVSVQEGIRHKS